MVSPVLSFTSAWIPAKAPRPATRSRRRRRLPGTGAASAPSAAAAATTVSGNCQSTPVVPYVVAARATTVTAAPSARPAQRRATARRVAARANWTSSVYAKPSRKVHGSIVRGTVRNPSGP